MGRKPGEKFAQSLQGVGGVPRGGGSGGCQTPPHPPLPGDAELLSKTLGGAHEEGRNRGLCVFLGSVWGGRSPFWRSSVFDPSTHISRRDPSATHGAVHLHCHAPRRTTDVTSQFIKINIDTTMPTQHSGRGKTRVGRQAWPYVTTDGDRAHDVWEGDGGPAALYRVRRAAHADTPPRWRPRQRAMHTQTASALLRGARGERRDQFWGTIRGQPSLCSATSSKSALLPRGSVGRMGGGGGGGGGGGLPYGLSNYRGGGVVWGHFRWVKFQQTSNFGAGPSDAGNFNTPTVKACALLSTRTKAHEHPRRRPTSHCQASNMNGRDEQTDGPQRRNNPRRRHGGCARSRKCPKLRKKHFVAKISAPN